MSGISDTMDLTYLIDENYQPVTTVSCSDSLDTTEESKFNPNKILADISGECDCKNSCSKQLLTDKHMVKRIQRTRFQYFEAPQGNKRTTMTIQMIRNSLHINGKGRKLHSFEGNIICMNKWIDVIGISQATYYRALSYIKQNVYEVEKSRKPYCSGVRGLDACGFIRNCLEKYGDNSPEREKLLLPPCVTKKFIYEEYLENPGPHIKQKHFLHLFNKEFSKQVSFAKANNELHKLQNDLDKEALKCDLKIHLNRQSQERQDYYKKKKEAHTKPEETMSVIIDGMDQGKTSLPHFRGWCRAKSASPATKTHITGVMVHGKKNFFFVDLLQWQHDPNLSLTCLINALVGSRTQFPPKLYIQCDNCGRENKNKYVIGFLAYLCHAGYFKEIYLSFLLKGHTHEDIDQQFSKISQHLKTKNVMTLSQLEASIQECFLQKPLAESLKHVWDVKSWIGDFLNDMQNHSFPHQFWIFCDKPGHVTLKTRMWSTDEWVPKPDEKQLEIFNLDKDGNQALPTGVPEMCVPNYDKLNLPQAKSSIEKAKIHLSLDEYNWWINFLEAPEKMNESIGVWPLQAIAKLHKTEINRRFPLCTINRNTCISSLLNAEQKCREVITVQRKKRVQKEN